MDEKQFVDALKARHIPTLVLDQKWHRLFAISGKPDNIKTLEVEEKEILVRQGHLNQELRELKKIKNDLMKGIVDNMEGADANKATAESEKKLSDNKRLLNETNDKIDADEDELMEIPKLLKEKNDELMLATMNFCYARLRTNASEAKEITEWITNVRIELKKNIIKKQNREINNKEIYSYLHDLFGKDVMQLFDVHYDEQELPIGSSQPEVSSTVKKKEEKEANKDRTTNFDVKKEE
ncbi:MAG: hypothetical protein K6F30_01790 [Lachnospiraceae bacterium]|nr:hypothetical protein [Lachnospiraceae bacterium]